MQMELDAYGRQQSVNSPECSFNNRGQSFGLLWFLYYFAIHSPNTHFTLFTSWQANTIVLTFSHLILWSGLFQL